jgi:hypothetical protein
MFANLQPRSRKCCRADYALPVIFMISILLLSVLTARAEAPKQALNPMMPEILEKVAQQLPDAWHPKQTRNEDVLLHNPVQHLNARIHRDGIHLIAADGFAFNMQLTHFGFSGALKKPRPGGVQINGVRVNVIHDRDLSEWFVNSPVGIEQGFRLIRAIEKPKNGRYGSVRDNFELHFKISGDLIPELTARGLDFQDKSGQVRMHYRQLLAYDANHQILPAEFRLAGNHLSISVDTTGAAYPVIIDPIFSSEQSLTAGDAAAEDQFASAVAVDADTIVVGAPLVDLGTSNDAGAAYVFMRDPSSGIFLQQQKLTAGDAAAGDRFGSAVHVDGNTLVVGAPLADSGTSFDAGAVYVFTRDPLIANNPWTQQQKLTAADVAADDRFGSSVHIEGNTLAGGAPRKDDGTSNATGAAYVFTRDPDVLAFPWTQQQKLTAGDASADDQFGTSISISGSTIVAGAPLADLGTSFDAGALYVFTRDQTLSLDPWTLRQKLTASNAGADDRLGTSVSVDANTILAGAPREDAAGFVDSGAAYVFTRGSASVNFSQKQILRAVFSGSNNQFGTSVFVDGSTAMIGAPLERFLTSTDAGAAYFFARDPLSGNWRQQQRLTGSSPESLSEFGGAVAVNAVSAVIGSAKRDQGTSNSAGAALVFVLKPFNDEIAKETDMLSAANAAANDGFGSAVGLSGDNTLIGIPDADPGVDINAGEVSAFERDPTTQVFDDESTLTAGDRTVQDNFGAAVSVDADIAVIGAPAANIGGDPDTGGAYVFTRDPVDGDWDQSDKLTAGGDVNALDRFGTSVAVDADVILIGAPFHNPNGSPNGGAAFLFSRDPDEVAANQWSETQKLTAGIDEDMDDNFGTSVALNSDTALVGAPFENGGGAVFVFVRDPDVNSWDRQQKLTAADANPGDEFGYSVSVFGNTAIIGAPQADSSGALTAGAVYVFTRDPTDATSPWSQRQRLEAFDAAAGDEFGAAVSLAGNTAVVGAPGVDLPDGLVLLNNAGAAYDFRRDSDTGLFSLRSKLTASDAAADESFGTAVVVACDSMIIGAPEADLIGLLIDAGAAFVFQTSEDRGDADGGPKSSGSGTCFIGTAVHGFQLNFAMVVLAIGMLGLVGIFLKGTRYKRKSVKN